MRFGHIPALKQLLELNLQTARCQLAAGALQQLCPGVLPPSASGPCSAGSHLHCSLKHTGSILQAWRPNSMACFASIHLNWTLFLSLVSSLPLRSFSIRFLGTMVHQWHHKAFSGSAVSCGLKPWQGPCQWWHSECGTSQGFRAWPVPAYRCSLATFACWEAEPDGSPSGWAKSKSVLFKPGTQQFCQIFHSVWS